MVEEFLALAVTAFALGIASILALRFRIPPIVVFLIMGMVIGTSGYLQQNQEISYLGDLGSALLLFAIGTEFSIYKLFSSGLFKEIRIALIELLFSFIVLYFIFQFLFGAVIAILLALAFSITSTGISLKLLEELGLTKKFDVPMIIKISVIEDLIAVFIFAMISSAEVLHNQPLVGILISFLVSIALFVITYLAFYVFLDKFLFRYEVKEEDLLMLALGVLLLMVSISGVLGLSTSFGAYISGSIVSTWKQRWRGIENDLKKFSYIFISFFFLTIGLKASFLQVDVPLLLLLVPLVLIVKFAGVFLGSYATYRASKLSFFTSVGMLSRGELTLIIVSGAVGAALIPQSFLSLSAVTVLCVILITAFLQIKGVDLYMSLRLRFPKNLNIRVRRNAFRRRRFGLF